MYNFVLQNFIIVSLGIIIFLVARTLPRITESDTAKPVKSRINWLSSFPFEKIDEAVNSFLEKFLRKIKLVLMKMDNTVSKYLNKFKKNSNSGNGGNGLMK